jgi:hypothetical protein
MLRTCETIDQELKDALASPEPMRKKQAGESIPAIRLELRDRIHRPGGGAFLFPPEHISSAIGISTLIVYRKKDSFYMLTGKRGQTGVAVSRGTSHVIPAFMFQPLTDACVGEYDISYNVYREFLEELFSIEEEYPRHCGLEKRKVLENPNILFIERLVEKKLAGLYFTGCLVNLASLRLEVCTLLLIHDPSWYDMHNEGRHGLARFCFNKEWDFLDEISIEGNIKIARASEYLPPGITVAGAGAIYLGFECLSKVL